MVLVMNALKNRKQGDVGVPGVGGAGLTEQWHLVETWKTDCITAPSGALCHKQQDPILVNISRKGMRGKARQVVQRMGWRPGELGQHTGAS